MNKNIILKFIAILFIFITNVNASVSTSDRPKWINDPLSECNENYEICASGEGTGVMMAEANARKAIAQYFETKVQSKSNYYKSLQQKEKERDKDTESSVRLDEDYSKQIEEITNELLKGVTIKKKFEDKDSYYAYAVLDKIVVQKELKKKIELIDEKMVSLQKEKGRGIYKQLLKYDTEREEINLRYQFLSGKAIPKVVSFEIINQKKLESSKNILIEVLYDKNSFGLKEMDPVLMKLLVDNDYKIYKGTGNKSEGTLFTLNGKFSYEEQFLNVAGFKRFRFVLNLYFQNAKMEKTHVTEHAIIKDGRSFEQAYNRALEEYIAFLKKEWEILTVE